jgi:hypothetical protein
VTRDLLAEPERLPALLDHDELSPELALVDPDLAERARGALPGIPLTEIRLSEKLEVDQTSQTSAPSIPQPGPDPVDVAELASAPAPAPRTGPRRRLFALAAFTVVAVAAVVALALPRALDAPRSRTSANVRSVAAPVPAAPAAGGAKAINKKAKPIDHRKARHRRAPDTRARERKPAPKKDTSAPPVSSRHVAKVKHQAAPARQRARALPDFVWVPVKNATGYLVEFRAGSKVVLRARTRAARLHLLARQLHPGRYRWLIWRVGKSGSPIGKPLVDSGVRVR